MALPAGGTPYCQRLIHQQQIAAPVADVEGRIGQDVVGLEVGEAVVVEAVAVGDLAVDAADGEVHARQPPGGVVRLLAVDADVAPGLPPIAVATGMGMNELDRLHEHPRGAATGVVHPPLVGFEHLDQQLDHTARRVELAALLALGAGELREEVLVDAAEHVLGAALSVADPDVADEIDELAEPQLVEGGAGIVLGQHALERGVVALDAGHGVVDELADGGLLGLGLEMRPARLGRHPEDVERPILVRVLGVGALVLLGLKLGVLRLEGVGDVLEEDQAEDDVLVFGRVHAAAQGVGHFPQFSLIAHSSGCPTVRFRCFGHEWSIP